MTMMTDLSGVQNPDGMSFRGFIRIHMNFSRPINVVAGERPPTIYDIVNHEDTVRRKTITSFFLPRNTAKVLHTTSDTTTQEMIVALLKKFKVADNPRKFALYERNLESGKTFQAKLRRISDYECPLRLYLIWNNDPSKRFVLQENETGEICWEAFEIPELQNFLRILEREEELYIYQLRRKYEMYRRFLLKELDLRGMLEHAGAYANVQNGGLTAEPFANFDADFPLPPPDFPAPTAPPPDAIDGLDLGTLSSIGLSDMDLNTGSSFDTVRYMPLSDEQDGTAKSQNGRVAGAKMTSDDVQGDSDLTGTLKKAPY